MSDLLKKYTLWMDFMSKLRNKLSTAANCYSVKSYLVKFMYTNF